jgi:sugar lactone lactonase YvrE
VLRAPRRRFSATLAALLGVTLALPSVAAALDDCQRVPGQRVLVSGRGQLESVIVDDRGHLFFTDADAGELLRMDRRGSEPRVLVSGIPAPGGLEFLPDGSLLVGYGDSAATARSDPPQAGLLRVDPKTGEQRPYASGLSMSNGVARGPDGAIYASNDFGPGVDRVLDGQVTLNWAAVESSNGLVVDSTGTWLYVAQTFVASAISRVELADPTHVETWYAAPAADSSAILDGLTRDAHDRLYVAANLAGEVWRVKEGGPGCVLAHLPPLGPSSLAFGTAPAGPGGRPQGFGRRNLYVVTFRGDLVQLKDVRGKR